ncbi:MAG: septal ring lytic transglycosylase RlpA family protein [Solirubrobacteraceae bacterium]
MDLNLIGTRRANAYAVLILLSGLFALPSLAEAGSGGGSLSPSGGASTTGPSATTQPGNVAVSATGDGITLTTNASAMLRRGLSFAGTASPSEAGQTIEIERLGHETNWQWTPTVTATVASDGSFSAVWSTNHIGRFSIRAVFAGATAGAASAPPELTTTVYRQSLATIYGPGLYGRHTACGERLSRATIGVANRTLKCGTQVAVYYQGRTMIVPVIDRGPYANGADWDVTAATARALGMDGTANVGAVSLPVQPSVTLTPPS